MDDFDSKDLHTRVECIENRLDAEIKKCEHTLRITKRLNQAVPIALVTYSICSLGLENGTMGSACTGKGIAASFLWFTLASLSATATMVFSLIQKRIAKKKKKKHNLTIGEIIQNPGRTKYY